MPRDRLGLQQFSIRDSITRLDQSVTGYLGGPQLPAGRGGHRAGRRPARRLPPRCSSTWPPSATTAFEFFSFNQGANGPITNEEIRTALDNAGLKAAGTHTGGLQAMTRARQPPGPDRPRRDPRLPHGRHGRQPGEPDAGHARRLEAVRGAGQHGRRRVPRRGHQVLLPPRAGLVPLLRRPGAPGARPRAPHRLVHRQHRPEAGLLRAGHDAHARRARALPGPRRRAALRRQRLVRPARRRSTGSSRGTRRTPTGSSRSPRRAPTRSRRRGRGRASRSTAASTSSTSARARSPAATRSTPTPR